MSRARLVDTVGADEVSWEFMQDKGFVDAVAWRVRRVAAQRGLDPDDLLQETLMFIAARPGWAERGRKNPAFAVLSTAAYMSGDDPRLVPLDDAHERAVGIDGR